MDHQKQQHRSPAGLTPLTPQAVRLGFTTPVYVTPAVWSAVIRKGEQKATPDSRIFGLLDSMGTGIAKAVAGNNDDGLWVPFKHWHTPNDRPGAKKAIETKLGTRVFIDPRDGEPWLLIFHPQHDNWEYRDDGAED